MKIDTLPESNEKGFTILELLIATTVLSVILVMVSFVMVGIGNIYQKGINQARVQTSTRNITREVSEQLQLMNRSSAFVGPSSPAPGRFKTFCFGDVRYTYVIGEQLGTDSSPENPKIPHVLWRDTPGAAACAAGPALDLSTNNANGEPNGSASGGTELGPANSRLTVFDISSTLSGLYTVNVGVAYGDTDLLTSPPIGPTVRCNSGAGNQFCSAAFLSTVVGRRL